MGLTQVTGKGITDGTIFNVDVHASAAIAGSKISPDFGSQDITTTGHIDLPDDSKLKLGDSDDFDIYHQSSNGNSIIREQGGGILSLQTNGSQVSFYDITNTVIMAEFNTGGSCSFRHGATTRLATNSTGATVTGNLAVTGTVDGRDLATDGTKLDGIESNATADQTASEIVALIADQTIAPSIIDMEDNEKIKLGNSDDLEIYHSGSHSRFLDNGAGKIQFGSDTGVEVLTANFATQIALFDSTQILLKENTSITGNLAVSGTVDGVDVATRDTLFGGLTSSSGVLTNGVTATTQSAGDNSTKVATTAYTDTAIANLADSAPSTLNTLNELAAALGDDANFSTTVTNSIATKMPLAGGTFTGDVIFTGDNYNAFWDKSVNALQFSDNAKATFGNHAGAGDLQIYHNGTHSFLKNSTGTLVLNSDGISLTNEAGNSNRITTHSGGEVKLYHSDSVKLETTANGIIATGNDATGNILIGDLRLKQTSGDTTYVKWDASHSKLEFMDNVYAMFGNGNDLEIFHNGNNSFIRHVGTGNLHLKPNSNEEGIVLIPDGAVELYNNGGKKFETRSDGVKLSQGHFYADDSSRIKLGDSSDLQLYHDGSDSIVIGSGTGSLKLQCNVSNEHVQVLAPANGDFRAYVNNGTLAIICNAATQNTELRCGGTKRLETTSSGVNVVGALTINGAALGGGNPTGTVISYAGSSAPTGYLKANGDSIPNGSGTVQGVTEDFSDLYAIVGSSLPDLRGEFVRGLDDGRGVDSGRSIRSSQSGQNVSHSHTTNTTINHNNNNSKDLQGQFNGEERDGRPSGVFYTVGGRGRDFDGGDGDYIGFDGRHRHGTTSSGGSEARPRNVALLMCIKY